MSNATAYIAIKVNQIQGRYVTNAHIIDFLKSLNGSFGLETLGTSVLGNPIYGLTIGNGPKRILMWSQMHGNESTTTKAVLDFMNFLKQGSDTSKEILQQFTLKIIPILNPDGAKAYTRINANKVDLNRDAQDISQPESKLLRTAYDSFQPHFCFNLHDQRTIFNVGKTDKPATVSFLAPAFDTERNLSNSRILSMQLIAAMNKGLQEYIPGQVGRYDDGFNANCVGDAFQMLQTPTVLFEAGHFSGDYERETTRKFIYLALRQALTSIYMDTLNQFTVNDYLEIPENQKMYSDVRIKNAHILDKRLNPGSVSFFLFKERLTDNGIVFLPEIMSGESAAPVFFAHETKDAALAADAEWLKKRGFFSLF